MGMHPLENSILRTLSYFDIFSLPLTAEELFCFLWRPPATKKEDFLSELKLLIDNNRVSVQDDYYFLPGKNECVQQRLSGQKECAQKIKKAIRAAKILRSIPFLKAIFICNSVAAGTAKEESDIDFLVVGASGRLWLVRTLANFWLRLFGLRTYGSKIANRVCLSFFVDDKSLDFSSLRAVEEDIHFAYWIHQTIPLFDPEGLWDKFINLNQWTVRYLPNVRLLDKKEPLVKLTKFSDCWSKVWQKFWQGGYGDLIEQQAEALGRQNIKFSIKERIEQGDKNLVLNKKVIKLHEQDARLEVKNKWEEKMRILGIF